MNWLAHLHLGGADPLERLGHLSGDFVRGADVASLPPPIRRGVLGHRAIDAFTDSHPVVRRSRARVGAPLGRFAGVLVDVFYDHLLARDWATHAPDTPPLRRFVDDVHGQLLRHRDVLPPRLKAIAPRMVAEDWLGSYDTLAGVRAILARMERRLRRPVRLRDGAAQLAARADGFAADFRAFYPELCAFAAGVRDA